MKVSAVVGWVSMGLAACSGEVSEAGGDGGEGPTTGAAGTMLNGAGGSTVGSAGPSTTTGPGGSTTTGSGGSASGGGGSAGTAPSGPTDYAPYLPTWAWGGGGYAYSSLVDLKSKSGLDQVTIAFVLSGGTCRASGEVGQHLSDIKAFMAAGGHVKASFGGASGTYVESGCADATALAKAIGDFVTATGITDLDFDIEQDTWLTDSANDMRAKALKMVQDSKNIKVAFTLEALPATGLSDRGRSLVSRAVAAGVRVAHVNLMTMDYGDSFGGKPMAPVVIGSLNGVHYQLQTLIPGLTSQQAWAMVGVIPMIGKNDDSEIFSLADAKTVTQFAIDNKLGLVSFWSIDRDQPCGSGREACNSVSTTNFEFTRIFAAAAP